MHFFSSFRSVRQEIPKGENMYKKFLMILAIGATLTLFSSAAFGQVTGGSVSGTVLDPNDAAVPGAAVTLTHKATGQTLTSQTTGGGGFAFPNVPVGEYTLAVQASGFARKTMDIRVALNQETSAGVKLDPEGVTAAITVTAASEVLVQTTSSQLGKSYETRLVQNLPIFGNQNALALLAPNVVERSSGVLGAGGAVGGTRPRGNQFILDGVDNNDPSVTGPVIGVIQDAVAEFTLLQNTYNAEFGGGGGGQFVTITRSGTNEFHGSGFVYAQHQRLNATNTAEERQLQQGAIGVKPRDRNTRYGGTFGGPILRDRLFFFGALELTVNSSEGSSASYTAPTAATLGQLAGFPGVRPFIINFLQNNLILPQAETTRVNVFGPANLICAQTPNHPNCFPFGLVSVNIPAGFRDNSFQINVDHNRGTKDQFRYRFSWSDFSAEDPGLGHTKFNSLTVLESRLFSATWVRTFSPSVVNDLRLSYRRFIQDFPLKDPANLAFPNVAVLPLGIEIGPSGNLPQSGADNVYQVYDSLTYIRGSHTFKFGGEFRRTLTGSNFLARQRGDYLYQSLEELLLDRSPTTHDEAIRGVGDGSNIGSFSTWNFFVQDDWRVTPNLTLNLGLRYEFNSIPRFVNDYLPFFAGVSVPGLDFENVEPDRNNFAPRIGFAYAPDFENGVLGWLFGRRGQSSIRVNAAMSYNSTFQNLIIFAQPPQIAQEIDINQVLTAIPNFNTAPGFLERGGLPPVQLPFTGGPAAIRAFIGGINNTEVFRASEIYSWALSFQRELTPTMALELRYIGTRGRHLPVQIPLNLPNTVESALVIPTFLSQPSAAQLQGLTTLDDIFNRPDIFVQPFANQGFFGAVTGFPMVGNSQYDGASISVTRRFSQGLAFTTAYTWSKTIDDSTNELFSSVVNPRRPQSFNNLRDERSLSALDIPHRFVFAANYEIPLFRNHRNQFVKSFFGGWEIAPIFQAQSGQPFTALSGLDANLNFDSAPDRTVFNPNGTPGTGSGITAVGLVNGVVTTLGLGDGRTQAYVAANPNAQYIRAGFGALATAGRNTIRSNGFNRTDLTIIKNFRFGEERYNLQFGAEIFNLWNQRIRTIGGGPSGDAGVGPTNNAFNRVISPTFNDYSTGIFGGRTIQLRAKFIF